VRFVRFLSPRNLASASRLDVDANVLFALNLPPKTAANHKPELAITLAYDQNKAKSLQRYSL